VRLDAVKRMSVFAADSEPKPNIATSPIVADALEGFSDALTALVHESTALLPSDKSKSQPKASLGAASPSAVGSADPIGRSSSEHAPALKSAGSLSLADVPHPDYPTLLSAVHR
jgi:hypothetical protein